MRPSTFHRPVGQGELIVAMFQNKLRPSDIGKRLNLDIFHVWSAITRAREAGKLPPPYRRPARTPDSKSIVNFYSKDVIDALEPHATKRHLSVSRLVALLIDQVASSNLVDAIMDDNVMCSKREGR